MRLHIILVNLGFFIFLSPRVHHVDGFASSSIGAENLPHPSTKSNAVQYVGKTIESFKLADVYWLESCMYAYNTRNQTIGTSEPVQQLAFHRPTASYLLGYSSKCATPCELPFRTCRFQYIAKEIARGDTQEELLESIRHIRFMDDPSLLWTISYDVFEPLHPKVSSTMLVCAMSRLLPGEPLLNRESRMGGVKSYMVIETSSRLYLVERLDQDQNDKYFHDTDTQQFRDVWTKRPFQYSGAINLDLAMTVIDVLGHVLFKKNTMPRTMRLLDPTCGSGTFLALSVSKWAGLANLELVGFDSNPKCAAGTASNLVKTFSIGDDHVYRDETDSRCSVTFPSDDYFPLQSVAKIITGDSSQLNTTAFGEPFDCAVTNLPWNRNTFEYESADSPARNKASQSVHTRILKSVASALKPRAPIVVISADSTDDVKDDTGINSFNAQTCLKDLGFEVLGCASVPPKGFALPESKKGTGFLSKKLKGSSHCSIVIALAPW
ncbi:hypothetical protein ACHAXN_000533 [Cyclotella atomus]